MALKNSFKWIMLGVVGICITSCCLLVILPIFTGFYMTKTFVKFLIKIKYKDKAVIGKGSDVLFGTTGSESYSVVNVAVRIKGQMDVPTFKSRVTNVFQSSKNEKGQQRYRRMTQTYIQEYGYTMWKDYEDFNIDQHISVIRIEDLVKKSLENELEGQHGPANSVHVEKLRQIIECDKNVDWKTLMKIVLNEIGHKTINVQIPQWQVTFIEESKERYTLLYRFNHAIADGVYMTRLLCEDFLLSPVEIFHSYVPPSGLQSFILNLWSFSLLPFGLWKISKNNDKNVLHGTKLSGKKRYYLSNSTELDNLRDIKKKTHIGAYKILFSCLSNALASHFTRRSTIVKDVTAIIPIPRQNLQKSLEFKNKFAILTLKIPTPPKMKATLNGSLNNGRSSLERLHMLKLVFEDAKWDPSFIAANSIIKAVGSILPTSLSESLLSTKGVTLDFSNMPGPQTEISYGNDRIEDIMFWNPDDDPLGVGFSVLSYNGNFRVGLCIDEALLEEETEGDLLLQDFIDEVWNLKQELDNRQHTVEDSKLENAKFLKQYS